MNTPSLLRRHGTTTAIVVSESQRHQRRSRARVAGPAGAIAICLAISTGLANAAEADEVHVDLSSAKAIGTHNNGGRSPARLVLDGDENTAWTAGGLDLRAHPANILITLPKPAAVSGIEILTDDSKGFNRLTHLGAYTQSVEDWSLLGAIQNNKRLRFTLRFQPARVHRLRLRVRDTGRPDHAWPRIREFRLLAAAPKAPFVKTASGPVADESAEEAAFVARALGLAPRLPRTAYDPGKGYLWYVRRFADTLIERGTDQYGTIHSPMFISILDCRNLRHPGHILPPIEGQRLHDRASYGGNLQHDVPLLFALDSLSDLTGEEEYQRAGQDYLRFFLKHCVNSKTGLWPWGEHAHWDFYRDAPGHLTHEHLGLAPPMFWEWAWSLNPDAVRGEADGCLNHIVNLDTFDFNRHADISTPLRTPRPAKLYFLDFPRHGAFYLHMWALAWSKTDDTKYLDWINGMLDHFAANTHPQSGLMRMATEDRDRETARPGSSLSAALTLLEAAPLLRGRPEGERCSRMGNALINAIARLPHKLDEGEIVNACAYAGPELESRVRWTSPGFTAHYGEGFLGTTARMWVRAHELTGSTRCLDIARAVAAFYAQAGKAPDAPETPASVFGDAINLMLDLHEHDGGKQWLPAAESYAEQAIEGLYYNGLFRGATNLHYYESQLGVSHLAHALLRLHSLTDDRAGTVQSLHFAR
jgi:hypothetical protein